MRGIAEALRAAGLEQVEAEVDLADRTTLRVGGPAAAMVTVDTIEDLVAVASVVRAATVPAVVIGRGSNLLVSDRGWPGVVVRLGRGLRGAQVSADSGEVIAGGAEPLPTLAVSVTEAGLAGFAWAIGVPGTVGGAVRMNAGAHGRDIAADLVAVDVVRFATGGVVRVAAADLRLGYRTSALAPDDVVVRAHLRFEHGPIEGLRQELANIRDWRRTHQPINEPSCGSVFTNPAGSSAGALIEQAGLKGARIGGAAVSTLHANFIVTRPGASADDVARLIEHVRARVLEASGIALEPEVVRLGVFDDPDVGVVTSGPEGGPGRRT
jgi:UDP-N-acetylmuramate dehydrogenase